MEAGEHAACSIKSLALLRAVFHLKAMTCMVSACYAYLLVLLNGVTDCPEVKSFLREMIDMVLPQASRIEIQRSKTFESDLVE